MHVGRLKRRIDSAAILVTACLLAFSPMSGAQEVSADAIKATFLSRFSGYVQWPESASSHEVTIGVVDQEGVARQLERLLPAISSDDRRIRMKRLRGGDSLDGIEVLFVGASASIPARLFREAAIGKPILLVADFPRALGAGAIINFVEEDRTVRFEVSLTNAARAGLRINSRLLSVATRVEGATSTSERCPEPEAVVAGSAKCAPSSISHTSQTTSAQ